MSERRREVKKKVEEIEKLANQIKGNILKIRRSEDTIRDLNHKIIDMGSREYLITNEKELKSFRSEKEALDSNLRHENEEIERLNRINSAKESQVKKLKEELNYLKEQLEQVESQSNIELEQIEREKGSLYKEREEIIHKMDKKILSFYEKIKKWAGNSAVVPVRKTKLVMDCYP